jgi:hypothetical protein
MEPVDREESLKRQEHVEREDNVDFHRGSWKDSRPARSLKKMKLMPRRRDGKRDLRRQRNSDPELAT